MKDDLKQVHPKLAKAVEDLYDECFVRARGEMRSDGVLNYKTTPWEAFALGLTLGVVETLRDRVRE